MGNQVINNLSVKNAQLQAENTQLKAQLAEVTKKDEEK